ncbi:hypothetical protein D3C72_2073070 [compost metagenome]
MPETLPGRGTVHPGGAQQLLRHRLQASHDHDHGEGKLAPDIDHDQRGQDSVDVVDEIGLAVGEAELNQHLADNAEIGVVHPFPDVRRGNRADDPGDDQYGT